MKSSIVNQPGLDHLDALSAENPSMLLDSFESLCAQYQDSGSISHLTYFKAQALHSLKKYDEAIHTCTDLLGKAVIKKDYFLLVKCNLLLSSCYYHSGAKHRVKSCLELAEEYAQASQETELLADTLSHFGSYYLDSREMEAAQDYLLKAVKLSKRLPASVTTIKLLEKAASLFHAQNKHDTEAQYLIAALKMCPEADVVMGRLHIISKLAKTYTEMKKHTLAEELITQAIEFCQEDNHPSYQQQFTFELGICKARQDKLPEAIQAFDTALSMAEVRPMDNPRLLIDIYQNYAVCHGLNNEHTLALECLNRAFALAQDIDNAEDCMQLNADKAQVMINLGRFDEAKELLIDVIAFHKKSRNYPAMLAAQTNLAMLMEKQQDYKDCLKVHKSIEKAYENHLKQIMQDKNETALRQAQELSNCYQLVRSMESATPPCSCKRDASQYIGAGSASRKILNSALLAAQNPNANVFLMGESGTGKELIARMIHQKSLRRSFNFILVNPSDISTELMESEMFGHTKGAFTGAIADSSGYLVQAHQGTLFLDEVTAMPLEFQAKLLQAIETKKVTPVGSSSEVDFDCRIVSSTNRNIYELIQRHEFRLDLFHRLNPLEIYIPSLRSRPDDIELLVEHFIDIFTYETKKLKPQIDKSFIDCLKSYSFPGNVRELKNIIERLFIITDAPHWDSSVFSLANNNYYDYYLPKSSATDKKKNETEMIIKALIEAGGKQKDAAKILDMSESTLTRRIDKFKLHEYTRKGK